MKKETTLACCLCNHTGQCDYYQAKTEPKGTIIAGWTVFSDFRATAPRFGLNYEQLRHLTDLASEYEVKYDGLARQISSLRLRLSKEEMTYKEAKAVLDKINTISTQADYLFLDFAYKGREIIPDEIWGNYKNRVNKIAKEQRII